MHVSNLVPFGTRREGVLRPGRTPAAGARWRCDGRHVRRTAAMQDTLTGLSIARLDSRVRQQLQPNHCIYIANGLRKLCLTYYGGPVFEQRQ